MIWFNNNRHLKMISWINFEARPKFRLRCYCGAFWQKFAGTNEASMSSSCFQSSVTIETNQKDAGVQARISLGHGQGVKPVSIELWWKVNFKYIRFIKCECYHPCKCLCWNPCLQLFGWNWTRWMVLSWCFSIRYRRMFNNLSRILFATSFQFHFRWRT